MSYYYIICGLKYYLVLFKDRADAGRRLAKAVAAKSFKKPVVVSLLRGGIVIGVEIARALKCDHFPLPVAKISSPRQEELAIGALCFNEVYLDKKIIDSVGINRQAVIKQIKKARNKFDSYRRRFEIKKSSFSKIKNKAAILVDDGIATGATIKAGALFLKTLDPKKIVIAAPVAPGDFSSSGFDDEVIYYKDPDLRSISRFYEKFSQLTDSQVKKLLGKNPLY